MDLAVGRSLVERFRAAAATPEPGSVSTVQRGMLIFERLHPGTAVFNLRQVLSHTGPLAEDRLDQALTTLVGRHAALRSRFVDGGDGLPTRIVDEPFPVRVHWTDLSHLASGRRREAALRLAGQVAEQPFDLAAGPLVRVHGYRLGHHERLLVFVAHHLVCDGVSLQVLLSELDPAYRQELAGTAPEPLAARPRPQALDYWRTQLAGLPTLDLPADRPRPAHPTFRAGSVPVTIDRELVTAAEHLAGAEHATLFMVILAAFQLLLATTSGQDDFAVGAPEAGRARRGQHGVVGLVADLLVLRADLTGRPTFRELVGRVRETTLAAFAHRGVPFEDLVAALAPGRHTDGALVRACLAFHGDAGQPTLAGAPLRPVQMPRTALRYDVDLHLWRVDGRLWGSWDYRSETFSAASAARLAGRLPVLLARALAAPDEPVDRLDLLTDEDRRSLSRWAHGPTEPAAPDLSLVDLFAAQVARTPDAVAVRDARRALTYAELDQRSHQLAHYLRGHGVGAGDMVGIRLSRSVDLAVAMLGIHKVAAAYVALDPAYPADRIDYMVRDSGARLVLTDPVFRQLDRQPSSAVDDGRVAPDQPAYLLYTSGSTGTPKGVLLTHRNVVPLVRWGTETFSPEDLAAVLAATSICFDVSVFEFFVPLCSGGTVVVVDNALSLLAETPDVTLLSAVPSAARALVEAGALPRTVRVVGLAGEAVPGSLVDDLYATGHVRAVFNLYGPTEDTTYSTCARLLAGQQPPPIGALLPHERGYVLDRALRQVPVGAVGELYLAGSKLSWGYLNQAGLTAARFVADPFSPVPAERMYRTGDLVRYQSDGALLYLGRSDFQVKIRGQRIELGEIEATLQRHPAVRDAVVAKHGDRLVGYLVGRHAGGVDLADVRAYLRRTLPVVMVPSTLLVLDQLPRTPNGKLDRRALPAPPAETAGRREPPRGPDEALVAEVWRQVLERDEVGREDDFFDLGGDSLLAGKVLSRLRARAGTSLPLRLVFDHPRLADLAAALAGHGSDAAAAAVRPRTADAEPVLSRDQQRLWLECQLRPGTAYHLHGRRWLRGELDVAVLERSIAAIVDRHEVLRTSFPYRGGRPVQQVAAADANWRLPVVTVDRPEAAERLADEQAAMPLSVTSGPLFRCLLIRLGETEHLLAVTIHHLIADAWSVGLFLRELSALYQAGGDPARADLPELPVQYQDYAVWQHRWQTPAWRAEQLRYWRQRLAGVPQQLPLPTSRRHQPGQGELAGRVWAWLGPEPEAALRRLCRAHDLTPFMVMTALLSVVLWRWSGQSDLLLGVAVNTRRDPAVEPLLGLFVNTVPVRIDLTGRPSFGELAARVRRAVLDDCVNHGETQLDDLIRELPVVRDPLRAPLFQVLLSMVDIAGADLRLPGVTVVDTEPPAPPGKVDLNLNVRRDGDAIGLELLYYADRYDAPLARALLDQLIALLVAVAEDPSRDLLGHQLPGPPAADGPAPPDPRLAAAAPTADPEALLAWLRTGEVRAVRLTAPLLRAVAALGRSAALTGLDCLFLAHHGDLTGHDVELARRLAPHGQLVGVYCAADTGAPLASYLVPSDWSAGYTPLRLPIGTPLASEATVRNPAGCQAATGEVGELWFGERCTGQPARWRPDGQLELAGPAARGAPDPLEVVAALRDLANVDDALVVPGQDGGWSAYVAGDAIDVDQLRQHLVTRLPAPQIPHPVTVCRRLPLTADGDYDLAALPDHGGAGVPAVPRWRP